MRTSGDPADSDSGQGTDSGRHLGAGGGRLGNAHAGGGDALSLPALAKGVPGGKERVADQPVSGGHHQQHSQPGLVQNQGRHSRKGERQLLPDGQQDESAGPGPGARLYLGCGAGRSRLH